MILNLRYFDSISSSLTEVGTIVWLLTADLKGLPKRRLWPMAFIRINVSTVHNKQDLIITRHFKKLYCLPRRGTTFTEFKMSSSVTVTSWQFSSSLGNCSVPARVTHGCRLISGNVNRWLGSLLSSFSMRSFRSLLTTGLQIF